VVRTEAAALAVDFIYLSFPIRASPDNLVDTALHLTLPNDLRNRPDGLGWKPIIDQQLRDRKAASEMINDWPMIFQQIHIEYLLWLVMVPKAVDSAQIEQTDNCIDA
ncbi:hypothetical protein STEG23_010334, partial [Scotinomys teguina]